MAISGVASASWEEAATSKGVDHMDWPKKYLEKLDQEIGEVKADLRGVHQRIDAVNERIDTVISTMNQRFDMVDRKFDIIDRKFDIVDRKFEDKFGGVYQRLDVMGQKIDGVNTWVMSLVVGTIASFAALIVTMWVTR